MRLGLSNSICSLVKPRRLRGSHMPFRVLLSRAVGPMRDGGPQQAHMAKATSKEKEVWVECSDKATLTASLEAGVKTFVFPNSDQGEKNLLDWSTLARFEAVQIQEDGSFASTSGTSGQVFRITSPEDLKTLESLIKNGDISGTVVMDATAWKVIPAENLVALVQASCTTPSASLPSCRLLAVATSASEAAVMLGALELGTDGILLRTDSPAQVRDLMEILMSRNQDAFPKLQYERAVVTAVKPVTGTGDRVCVDMASNMAPGEGLLVGNFSRGLFLVHSECEESCYINSRPFRVNAGPVHAYVHAPKERTAYLSELRSGTEVAVVDPSGRQRMAVVGRAKVEARPLVLVEAVLQEDPSGMPLSVLLQNAETVKLVGPSQAASYLGAETEGPGEKSWQAISVVSLNPGDVLYVLAQKDANMARHTGISIKESITEK